MKKIFLATLILISLGCKKNPEKFLLKSDSTWSFNCESKSYDKNSVLLSTTNYSYELIFESKTSGKYRKLNSNDSYKSFACEFVKGFIVGCKLDIKFENAGSFNLNFDKVKKKKMWLSETSDTGIDFFSASYTYVKYIRKVEMEKL